MRTVGKRIDKNNKLVERMPLSNNTNTLTNND